MTWQDLFRQTPRLRIQREDKPRRRQMKAGRKKEWFDDEGFWRELYPYMFTEKRLAMARSEMVKALRLAEPRGKDALDLCCGPGRCAITLAKRGYRVTGVDRTVFLLNKARARARRAQARITFLRGDMRDFVRPNSFDLAISMFTSFGYFDDKREDMRVLGNIFLSLRPGGVFFIDMVGKDPLMKAFQATTSSDYPDGTVLVQRHELFDDCSRIRNEWLLIRRNRVQRFRFHHTIYSGQEIKDRLEQAGFTRIRLCGDLDGAVYGRDAKRLIAIGRKPA